MMTGDGYSIGSKYGISFYGKWVWNLKDYIDIGFLDLFNPNKIFKDYKEKGTAEAIEMKEMFEGLDEDTKEKIR